MRGWIRRTVKTGLVVAVVVLVVAAGYVGYVAVRHAQPVALPAPTGPYRVGRVMYDWTDQTRMDPLAPAPGRPRELSVWLWYPAAQHAPARRAEYAPGEWRDLHLASPVGWAETRFGAIRTHALTGIRVAAGRFPVVVLEPGLGFAAPQYATLAEDLASHGYLVAGVTPTYSTNLTVLHGHAVHATTAGNPRAFETGNLHIGRAARTGDRLVAVWAADARFAAARVARLDASGRFAGHVDGSRTAYLGHSFGGAAALEACRTDPHCGGAADLDGTQFGPVVRAGLNEPLMILASQGSCVTGSCRPANAADAADRATARSMLAAGTGPAWCYRIAGMKHFNFTDYAAYYLAAPLRRLLALGPIDGDRGLRITGAYLTAFLDHAVRHRPEPLLAGTVTPYPAVQAQHTPAAHR